MSIRSLDLVAGDSRKCTPKSVQICKKTGVGYHLGLLVFIAKNNFFLKVRCEDFFLHALQAVSIA